MVGAGQGGAKQGFVYMAAHVCPTGRILLECYNIYSPTPTTTFPMLGTVKSRKNLLAQNFGQLLAHGYLVRMVVWSKVSCPVKSLGRIKEKCEMQNNLLMTNGYVSNRKLLPTFFSLFKILLPSVQLVK